MKRIVLFLCLVSALWAQQSGTPVSIIVVTDDNNLPQGQKVGGTCTNYSVVYWNPLLNHTVACVNTNPPQVSSQGTWTVGGGSGGGGGSYTAGPGLSLTGSQFSVNYGFAASTATQGNDSRVTSALNSASPLNATNLLSGTVPPARIPSPTASALGGVQSAACASSHHINSITTGGVPTCSADTGAGGGSAHPTGATAANRPAGVPGTGGFFLQLDRNPGDQLAYYNGTNWFYPGTVDSTMTRDAATGAFGINPSSVPRLGSANTFTAANHFSTVQLDACTQADGT